MGQPLADCDFNQAACTQLTPSSAERARREHRHPKASNPEETPALDPLENNIRKERPFADDIPDDNVPTELNRTHAVMRPVAQVSLMGL
jgi:hypothetical protein